MKELNEGLESYDIITHQDEMFSEEELTEDEEKLLDELGLFGESRRKFLGQVGATGFGMLALQVLANQDAIAAEGGLITSILSATFGAVVLLFVVGLVKKA